MSHYYLNDEQLKDNIKIIKINVKNRSFQFKTNDGVFSKQGLDFGSRLLIDNVEITEDVKKVADIGAGYGPIGIIIGSLHSNVKVYLYEINERAVFLAEENIKINKVNNVVVYKNNILENVDQMFDVIVTNPPIRAGKNIVFEFYKQAYNRLNNKGSLYVVIQKKQGAESTLKKLTEIFNNTQIITKNKGYWIIKAEKQFIV